MMNRQGRFEGEPLGCPAERMAFGSIDEVQPASFESLQQF